MSLRGPDSFLDLNQHLNLINPVMRPDQVRSGDLVSCKLRIPSKVSVSSRLWSYCPFGFELDVAAEDVSKIPNSVECELQLGKSSFEVRGKVVFSRLNELTGNQIVGVRTFNGSETSPVQDIEKRRNSRWNCPDHLLPTGTAANPTRYNDFIFFRVIDISSNGLRIATSLRNKFLAIGQVLDATLSIPMIGSLAATLKISRCTIETLDGKDHLILGASLINADSVILSTLSEYLLTFAEGCSVQSLRDAGFEIKTTSTKFDFSYVKSQKDYDDVLNLRYEAYRDSGKLSPDVGPEFMKDEFDSRSRILIVKSQGKIVGSARAMFHELGDKTSHERYLQYPPNFPSIAESVEVSRVCVAPDFQGIGLAAELASHLALLTIKSGRKYCYLSAAGGLLDFWKRLGYASTGTEYNHEALGNLHHELLINPIAESVLGRSLTFKNWNAAYSNLFKYCVEFGLIEPSLIEIGRIRILRFLRGER